MELIANKVDEVLRSVPLGKEARTKQLGAMNGNAALGGYDCVIVSLPRRRGGRFLPPL